MNLRSYLFQALVIAACIPILDALAAWVLFRGADSKSRSMLMAWVGWGGAAAAPTPPQGDGAQRGPARHAPPDTSPMAAQDRDQCMARWNIAFDGRQFVYAGYRYDQLADAMAYAELMHGRQRAEAGQAA